MTRIKNEFGACEVHECDSLKHEVNASGLCSNHEQEYSIKDDEEFENQAIAICQDLGIPEDEADMLVNDFIDMN